MIFLDYGYLPSHSVPEKENGSSCFTSVCREGKWKPVSVGSCSMRRPRLTGAVSPDPLLLLSVGEVRVLGCAAHDVPDCWVSGSSSSECR